MKPISVGSVWCNESYGCSVVPASGAGCLNLPKASMLPLLINIGGEGCVFDRTETPWRALQTYTPWRFSTSAKAKRLWKYPIPPRAARKSISGSRAGSNRLPTSWWKKAILRQTDIVALRDDMVELYYDYMVLAMHKLNYRTGDPKLASIKEGALRGFQSG